MPKWICTGNERALQNDVLENGTCQTRPARQDYEREITVRETGSRLHDTHMHRRMKQQHESTRAAVTGHDRDSRPRAHQRPNNALDEVDDEHGVCEHDRRAARRSEGVLAERLNEGCQRQSQLPRICRQLHVRAARLASLSATAAHEHGRAREQGACRHGRWHATAR